VVGVAAMFDMSQHPLSFSTLTTDEIDEAQGSDIEETEDAPSQSSSEKPLLSIWEHRVSRFFEHIQVSAEGIATLRKIYSMFSDADVDIQNTSERRWDLRFMLCGMSFWYQQISQADPDCDVWDCVGDSIELRPNLWAKLECADDIVFELKYFHPGEAGRSTSSQISDDDLAGLFGTANVDKFGHTILWQFLGVLCMDFGAVPQYCAALPFRWPLSWVDSVDGALRIRESRGLFGEDEDADGPLPTAEETRGRQPQKRASADSAKAKKAVRPPSQGRPAPRKGTTTPRGKAGK